MEGAKRVLAEYGATVRSLSVYRSDVAILNEFDETVYISPVCAIAVVAPLVERGLLRNVELREAGAPKVLEKIMPKCLCLVDIAPFSTDMKWFGETYEFTPILKTRVGIIVLQNLVDDRKTTISAEDVARLPLGIFDNGTTRRMYEAIFGSGGPATVKVRTTDSRLLLRNVANGTYAALGDSFLWKRWIEGDNANASRLLFIPLEGNYDAEFGIASLRSSPRTPAQSAFVESFAREFARITSSLAM